MVSLIRIEGKTVKGVLVKRLTRFSALVKTGDKTIQSFLPNPGRLRELLTPGAEVILREVASEQRKTSHDLIGVYHEGQQVSLDARVPNKLVLEALRNKDLPMFAQYTRIEPEHIYGHTRFDFFLRDGQKPCMLEVKSCTLVRDGVALFPDARTERGARHLRDLVKAKNEGYRACILFIVQRDDARTFSPNRETDPEFEEALQQAAKQGVEVYAYRSVFVGDGITLKEEITVEL